jgi:glutamyl-tRNA synthetase
MRLALRRARLRFAPSPAGDLHVGHVRSAVLTWVLARQLSGDYFVRFENTDEAKEIAGSRAAIVADLDWLGLLGTHPPRDQAAMTGTYRAALERMAAGGHTYTDGGAVRFRTPSTGTVEWDDLVRGSVAVGNADLGDPVLVRSSGTPTFYLASTMDDAEEAITHLVRAVPMVRATATQIHIWRSLGVEPPAVGHVPLVTGPGGAPVRFGSTAATVRALREHGIRPTAMLAYLAMPETASWKAPPADLEEIIPRINLRRLARRPMTFDQRALETLNRRQP